MNIRLHHGPFQKNLEIFDTCCDYYEFVGFNEEWFDFGLVFKRLIFIGVVLPNVFQIQ